jgi:hypothetical protein
MRFKSTATLKSMRLGDVERKDGVERLVIYTTYYYMPLSVSL